MELSHTNGGDENGVITLMVVMKMVSPPWKTVCAYPTRLILHLPYDPAVALVCILEEESICPCQDLHTNVHSSFI